MSRNSFLRLPVAGQPLLDNPMMDVRYRGFTGLDQERSSRVGNVGVRESVNVIPQFFSTVILSPEMLDRFVVILRNKCAWGLIVLASTLYVAVPESIKNFTHQRSQFVIGAFLIC